MMDYRGGQSVHSWDMGMRGECTEAEKNFMNLPEREWKLKENPDL